MAGIIPGLVALLIFEIVSPRSFVGFFNLGFLGYRTKLAIVLLIAFLIGNTMTTLLNMSTGEIGGAVGGALRRRSYTPPASEPIAPWRDPRWRTVLKKHLGGEAPADTNPIPQKIFEQTLALVEMMPETQRPAERYRINREKLNAEVADLKWSEWYDHYSQIVLKPDTRDLESHVRLGLNVNLEAAAIYILISSTYVPAVRHWWCILPACVWIVVGAGETYTVLNRFANKWSTLSDQIKYLSDAAPKLSDSQP